MSYNAAGAGSSGLAVVAMIQAIKASGAIVRVDSDAFMQILRRVEEPIVVCATGGFFTTNYQYLTSYKGLFFFTKATQPLMLPANSEVVEAKKISIPDI